jgi:hypothetical protein
MDTALQRNNPFSLSDLPTVYSRQWAACYSDAHHFPSPVHLDPADIIQALDQLSTALTSHISPQEETPLPLTRPRPRTKHISAPLEARTPRSRPRPPPGHFTEEPTSPTPHHSFPNPSHLRLPPEYHHDTPATQHLLLGPSTLPGAGTGAFASHDLRPNTIIAHYHGGPTVTPADVLAPQYITDYAFMDTRTNIAIDAYDYHAARPSCLAAFLNDPLDPPSVNVRMRVRRGIATKPTRVELVTTRAIPRHAELFVEYGQAYWLDPRRPLHLIERARIAYSSDSEEYPRIGIG